MNLPNIPFELIFIVLFFVLPALSNLLNRRNRQPPPGSGPAGRPGEPRRSSEGRRGGADRGADRGNAGSDRRNDREADRSSGSLMGPSSADSSDPLRRRLEEAQRRVENARGEAAGRRAQPTLVTSRDQPATQSTQSTRTTSQRPQGRPGQPAAGRQQMARPPQQAPRQSAGQQSAGQTSTRQATGRTDGYQFSGGDDMQRTAPALRVQRLGSRRRATHSEQSRRPIAFDKASIMQGFIWHQVLSPRRAKQPRRTTKSRR